MIIDKFTIAVLKNFASINSSILIKEGNVITSGIPDVIKATANLDVTFPKRFALDNLSKFIHILDIFGTSPDLNVEFFDNFLIVSSGSRQFKIMYTEESIIQDCIVSDQQIELPSIDVILNINSETFSQLSKALKILGLSEIHIHGDGETLFISIIDSENSSSDSYSVELKKSEQKFRAVFKAEHFNLFPCSYEITICKRGIARFLSDKLEYYITMDNNASFFE